MASRLLFQKFSGMSRSASLFGAHASAARAAAAPQGVFHGTPVHPAMTASSNSVTGYAVRYFNIFPRSHADAKMSLTTTGLQSTILNNMKSAFLDFGRQTRTLSSSTSKSNSHKFTMGAEIAARQAQDAARTPEKSVIESYKKRREYYYSLDGFYFL